ncbi:SIMPL domain-containing protein [Candidatus Methanoprimaticola sp. MG2]|uniref:SIMPL domain-containing protein n=1 Tax=Candidatus Methanoprimaticola sp. MG2 TaxID=3228838 RepID=UPI0039C64293
MERTVKVTGTGVSYAKPDQARIRGSIQGKRQVYADAVRAAADSVTALKKAIGDAGFDMDSLKTTRFSVHSEYRQEERDGVRVTVFDGFSFNHGISISTDAYDGSLGKLMEAMTSCDDAPQFGVEYYVSDSSDAMESARVMAVKDARHKAKSLASAAGVRLGQLVSISYGEQPSHGGVMLCRSMANDITPEDEEFTDSVTMEWAIDE